MERQKAVNSVNESGQFIFMNFTIFYMGSRDLENSLLSDFMMHVLFTQTMASLRMFTW